MITANSVKFIKLGRGGSWEDYCINNNLIALGFDNPYHDRCLEGDWDFIHNYWFDKSTKVTDAAKKSEATKITIQIKVFYTSPSDVMWITFHNSKLYWCFAQEEVEERKIDELYCVAKVRKVKGTWNSTDIYGNELLVSNLSGKLTMVQMFRGTICAVKESDYLLRRINDMVC